MKCSPAKLSCLRVSVLLQPFPLRIPCTTCMSVLADGTNVAGQRLSTVPVNDEAFPDGTPSGNPEQNDKTMTEMEATA
jgi:hypothetical protein